MWYDQAMVPWGGVGEVVAASVGKYAGPNIAWAEVDAQTGELWIFYSSLILEWSPPVTIAGPIEWSGYEAPSININLLAGGQILITWLEADVQAPGLYGRYWNLSEWEPAEFLFDGWGVRTVADNFPNANQIHFASHSIQPTCPCNAVFCTAGLPGSWSVPESIGSGHTGSEWEWPDEVAIHVTIANLPHLIWRHESYDMQMQLIDERLIHAFHDGDWTFDDSFAVGRNAHDPMVGTTWDGTPAVTWCDDSEGAGFDIYLATPQPLVAVPGGGESAPARMLTATIAPNPARRLAAIDVVSPIAGPLRVRIFDPQGRLVATLGGEVGAGTTQFLWDGRTSSGGRAPSGVYYLRIEAGSEAIGQRLVMLR